MLSALLDKLGFQPAKRTKTEYIYLSPLRAEKSPSFHVHIAKNVWYDHGIGEGGGVLEFALAWLKSQGESATIPDALRWLSNMGDVAPVIAPVADNKDTAEPTGALSLKAIEPITQKVLITYLEQRGIPLSTAKPYIKQLRLYNRQSGKSFVALGFPNEDKGWELRNKFFKGCIGSKNVSFVRGHQPKPNGIHIFEGFMDFLSALVHCDTTQFKDDAIVLNSLSCLSKATPYIKNYGYTMGFTWMDNDPAGEKATASLAEFFRTEEGLIHKPMNRLYQPHKDVNEWLMQRMGLTPKVGA